MRAGPPTGPAPPGRSPSRWFARSLVETGLIDEYRLVIHPVVLGAGERLFTAPLTIEPTSTIAFSRGAVAHVFARTRDRAAGTQVSRTGPRDGWAGTSGSAMHLISDTTV